MPVYPGPSFHPRVHPSAVETAAMNHFNCYYKMAFFKWDNVVGVGFGIAVLGLYGMSAVWDDGTYRSEVLEARATRLVAGGGNR